MYCFIKNIFYLTMDNLVKTLAIRFDFSHDRLIFFSGFTDRELKHFRAHILFLLFTVS